MTDKKFTDEEIIKRLEQCVKNKNRNYNTDIVLDLINRQKAEIERLKGSTIVNNIMESQKIKREAKVEAYKEFAKRLKELTRRFHYLGFSLDYALAVETSEIDNLLKEMIGNVSDNPSCSKTTEKMLNTEE